MPTRTVLIVGWVILFAVSSGLFVLVGTAAWWSHHRRLPGRSRRTRVAEYDRHATVAAARAGQAADAAERARAELVAAERACARAWRELAEADAGHDAAADRYHRVRRAVGPADPAARREVARAALAAHRRGDLSREQLWRIWRWGTGPDQRLVDREQELLRWRAVRREARLRYRTAAARERSAADAAEVAARRARALAEEAGAAAEEAGMARWSG